MNVGRRLRGLLGVTLVAALLGACGDTTESHPVKLNKNEVPFGLLAEPTTTLPQKTVATRRYAFVVYFEGRDGVVPVVRSASEPPNPKTVGVALLTGPTQDEADVGMRSAIPSAAIRGFGRPVRSTVTVDITQPFTEVSGSEQKIALAQIVLTLTLLKGVKQVRFLLDGEPVSVPRSNGTLTRAPVRRSDYVKQR
jgi:spore germination protein GerM